MFALKRIILNILVGNAKKTQRPRHFYIKVFDRFTLRATRWEEFYKKNANKTVKVLYDIQFHRVLSKIEMNSSKMFEILIQTLPKKNSLLTRIFFRLDKVSCHIKDLL